MNHAKKNERDGMSESGYSFHIFLSSFCIDLNFTSNIGFRKLENSTEKDCLDEETGWWRSKVKAEKYGACLAYKYDITPSNTATQDA